MAKAADTLSLHDRQALERARQSCMAGEFAAARRVLDRLIKRLAHVPDVAYLTARVRAEFGEAETALPLLEGLVSRGITHPDVLIEHCRALLAIGRPDLALRAASRYAGLHQGDVRSHMLLGQAAMQQRQYGLALTALEAAIKLAPKEPDTWIAAGIAANSAGEVERADALLAEAIAVAPQRWRARLIRPRLLPVHYADTAAIDSARQRYAEGLEQAIAAFPWDDPAAIADGVMAASEVSNFSLAYQGHNDRDLQVLWGGFLARLIAARFPALARPKERPPLGGRPFRLGILGSGFHDHTMVYLYRCWWEGLPRDRFDVTLCHLTGPVDGMTRSLADDRTKLHMIGGSLEQRLTAVREEAFDAILYTDIGMSSTIGCAAALRLAPAQLSGFGHPVTTGLPSVDFFLTPDSAEAPEPASHYSETVIRLPGFGVSFPPLPSAAPLSPQLLTALPPGPLLFCNQTLVKLHPDTLTLFARIAAALPEATILMLEVGQKAEVAAVKAAFAARFSEAGLDATARLRWLPSLSRPDFLGLCAHADLMLDTLHWSGGRSSFEAIGTGLVPVTHRGAYLRGRLTAGMLDRLGLGELVAKDADDYLAIVVTLIRDPQRLAEMRARLRAGAPALLADESWLPVLADGVSAMAAPMA